MCSLGSLQVPRILVVSARDHAVARTGGTGSNQTVTEQIPEEDAVPLWRPAALRSTTDCSRPGVALAPPKPPIG